MLTAAPVPTLEVVELLEDQVDADPLRQFARWRDEGGEEIGPVALATAAPDGAPSLRKVLLKGNDERGLTFFTKKYSRRSLRVDRVDGASGYRGAPARHRA